MQVVKPKFHNPDNSYYSSLQSCLRTIDLDLVGDGTHLTYFEMLGSFSFGNNDYHKSVKMWHSIVTELSVPVTHVTVHPTQEHHKKLWDDLGYVVIPDEECTWSDGEIGGFCCELFVNDLEIGNLVNPLGSSVDVGFGLERLVQVIEGKNRVDETSLFNQNWHPIVRDHARSVTHLLEQQIMPGNKGRYNVCKDIIRRMLPYLEEPLQPEVEYWVERERELIHQKTYTLERYRNSLHKKPYEYWYNTFGLTQQEIEIFLERVQEEQNG